MTPLPPLTSLLALDALYNCGSVTGAADKLGRSHSAVSKQLHQLQDYAGVSLFEKRGTGIELTSEGRMFAQVVNDSLDDMRGAYHRLIKRGSGDKVTLKVSSTFARLWAIPTVSRFNLAYPDIEVQISLTISVDSQNIDGNVDLVLSWDRLYRPVEEHLNPTPIGDVYIGPVLSPGYDHGFEDQLLSYHTQINRRGSESAWNRWSDLTGIERRFEQETSYDLSALSFEAAERGMGVALAPKFLIERELKSGSLIAPVGFLHFKDGLVVRPSSEKPTPSKNARIFLDWLSEHGRLGKDGFLAPSLIEPMWG